MKITHITGIDVSRRTLDYHHYNGLQKSQTIPNEDKGYKALLVVKKQFEQRCKGNHGSDGAYRVL